MIFRSFCPAVILFAAIATHEASAAVSNVERSEEVIGKVVPNYRLTNQEGEFVALHSLKGKYILVSFIYTQCPGPCVAITQSVADLFGKMDSQIVEKVHGLTITIDSDYDSAAKMKEYGLEFTDNLDRWTFARTDKETLPRLSQDMGFFFEKKGDGWFDHMNRLTLLGPDMRFITHFYGTDYDPVKVETAIRDYMEGRTTKNRLRDSLDYALVYCSNYDPVTGLYKVDYKFLAVIIFNDLLILGTILFFLRNHIFNLFSRITGGRIKSAS